MAEGGEISGMFGRIASRYDFANHLLSGGIDYYWRRKLVAFVKVHNPRWVVDLATGSGDLAFALKKALGDGTRVTGLDFCRPMLAQAQKKQSERAYAKDVAFDFGDCMNLPLEEGSVDVLTIAFGLRNFEDRARGLAEMRRVLRPGGRMFILEFSQPASWFRPFYYFYLKRVLPKMARIVTGDGDAYDYLAESIEQFPDKEALSLEIYQAGFREVSVFAMTGGVVAIHSGVV